MFDQDAPKSCEAEVLAQELLEWAEELAPAHAQATHLLEEERGEIILGVAAAIKTIRRGHDLQYGKINFGNPALRIMLEIALLEKNGRRISIEGLAALMGIGKVPVVHGVQTLADLGLIITTPEKCDGRSLWVQLSARAREAMFDMLIQAAEFLRPRGCGLPL